MIHRLFILVSLSILAGPVWGASSSILIQSHTTGTAAAGGAEITIVQSTSTSGIGNSASITPQSSVTGGNLLVLFATAYDNAAGGVVFASTPTDTCSNTYINAMEQDNSVDDVRVALWYAKNVTGGSCVISFTATAADYLGLSVHEYSGASTTAPLDDTASGNGSSTTPASAAVDTASTGGIVVAVVGHNGISEDITEGANMTIRRKHDGAGSADFSPLASEDRGSGGGLAAGSYTPGFTFSGSTSWGVAAATFKK